MWSGRDFRLRRTGRGRPFRCRRRQHYPGKSGRRPQGVRCALRSAVQSAVLAVRPVDRNADGQSRVAGVHWKIDKVSDRLSERTSTYSVVLPNTVEHES